MTSEEAYYAYLQTRSLTGRLYRRMWLYPKLCCHLKGRVLDVGCGLGDMLAFRPGTVGVDINPRTVEWCRSRGLDARLMKPDVLPFSGASFDGVVLDNVLEHIADPAALLKDISRVLKPEGVFVVGVPGRCGHDRDPDHKMFYSEERLVQRLAQFNFSCQHLFRMPLCLPWLESYLTQYCLYGVFCRG